MGAQQIEKENFWKNKKRGKARSKQFGKVEIPQEAFIGVLKINKRIDEKKIIYFFKRKHFRSR